MPAGSHDYLKGKEIQEGYTALSFQNMYTSIVFPTDLNARVVPQCLPASKTYLKTSLQYQSVQHENVMVIQRNQKSRNAKAMRVFFSTGMKERLVGKDGWYLLQEGDAFLAVKAFSRENGKDACAHSWEDDSWLHPDDGDAPVVFVMGRKTKYADMDAFADYIMSSATALEAQRFTIKIRDAHDTPLELSLFLDGSAIPLVNGKPIDFLPEKVFDSPFLYSKEGSGVVTIQKGGRSMIMDFNTTTVKDEPRGKDDDRMNGDKTAFEEALAGDWQVALFDDCTGDYEDKWFLDGEIAAVRNGEDGMRLTAGPQFRNDAHHMVLWTKEAFAGDLKIEYDYTRTDFEFNCVNIIYIQATGMGKEPYVEDISQWRHLRDVPSMAMYHDYMNTYHISYAVNHPTEDYVRARRYVPKGDDVREGLGKGLESTDLAPDYFETRLFAPVVPHHFCIIKKGQELSMKVSNPDQTKYFHWKNTTAPGIEHGRIGLRHMFTRSATYKNFTVSRPGKIRE